MDSSKSINRLVFLSYFMFDDLGSFIYSIHLTCLGVACFEQLDKTKLGLTIQHKPFCTSGTDACV